LLSHCDQPEKVCAGNLKLSRLFRNQQKLSWFIFLKTPIFAPFTPRESLLCKKIYNLRDAFGAPGADLVDVSRMLGW
jgi:hypothetical protein